MNLKGNLTSKGLQGSIGKSRMQGILGTNPAAIPITVDNALSLSSTNPVQNRVITAAITNRLWSDEVKAALLQIVEKVAYIDDQGQDYYDALYDALYQPTNLDSIVAVFDSSATIYNTDTLDDLKQYLTVTAYYTDGTSETVTTYTLSGSMDAGTQTITVSYGGKTTTFTVTIIALEVESIVAVFTQGSAYIYDTDSLDALRQYLVVTATYADSSTAVVADYTLSGALTVGASTITASYGGKTDTFSVTVSAYWNFEWTYAMGKLEEQTGWHADKTGTVSSTLETNGQKLVAAAMSGRNISIVPADTDYYRPSSGKMALEVVAVLHESSSTVVGLRLGIGPSYGAATSGGILTTTAAQRLNTFIGSVETAITPVQNDVEYTFKIEQIGTVGYVYLNGTLVQTIEDTSPTVYAGRTQVGWQNGGSGNYVLLKSVKIHAEGV